MTPPSPNFTVLVPPLTGLVHAASEKTLYVTVPVAEEASAPASVAESVTALPCGTVMAGPGLAPPPDSEVARVVGAAVTFTVSEPHKLADDWLLASPEYDAVQKYVPAT